MRSSRLKLLFAVVLYAGGMAGTGCAPVFSELQSAKLAGRGHHEFAANATRVSFSSDDNSDGAGQTELGLQYAAGVSDRVDVRARYVLVEGVHVVGVGPKVGLIRDRLAFSVPVGLGLNADDSLQVHPTLIGTLSASRDLEVNASVKYLIPLTENGGDNLVAFNVGLGIGSDRFKLRPEVGFMWNPGKEGRFAQFSLGMSFLTGR
jgi:hypothetical protein